MVDKQKLENMTPEQKAAAAAALAEQGIQAQTEQTNQAETQGDPTQDSQPEASSKSDVSEPESANSQEANAPVTPDAISVLSQQLADKDAQIIDLKVQIKTLEAAAANANEAVAGLSKIVSNSVSNMNIALGGSAVDASKLSPTELLNQHAQVSSTFTNKFKAGGVAATVADEEARPTQRSSRQAAALAATKLA